MIERFDAAKISNCDVWLRLANESWATIPMLRIVGILSVSQGIYSYRDLATMAGVSLGSVSTSVKSLVSGGYIAQTDEGLRLNLGSIKQPKAPKSPKSGVQYSEQSVQYSEQPEEKVFNILNKSVQNSEHTNISYIDHNNNDQVKIDEACNINDLSTNSSKSLIDVHLRPEKKSKVTARAFKKQPECPTDLPLDKVLRFEGEGKVEQLKNVWLSDLEVEKLIKTFGEENTFAGIHAAMIWSQNESPSFSKPKLKAYQLWHAYNDHYTTIKNLIRRQLSAGYTATHGVDGYEFVKGGGR